MGAVLLLLFVGGRAERLPVRAYTSADGLGSTAINQLLFDSRGFLWFATRDGLWRFDGYRFTQYKLGQSEGSSSIYQIIERRNGDYWAVEQSGTLYRFNSQTVATESKNDFSLTLNADKLSEKFPGKIFEDSRGQLWLSGKTGVKKITENENGLMIEPFPIELPDGENDLAVTDFIEAQDKTFWLATNRGLVRITSEGRVLSLYTTPQLAPIETYLSFLFADREGRIWVKSRDHLFVLKPESPENLSNPKVRPLEANKKTENAQLPEREGEIVRFGSADGMRAKVIPTIHQTRDGRIWMAGDNGLTVYDGREFKNFGAETGISEYLTDLTEDGDGNLWLASLSGVFKLVTGGFTTYTVADGLGRSDIEAIYQNKAGEIYVANGDWVVSRFDGKGFVSIKPDLGEDLGAPPWTSNVSFLDSHDSWWFLTKNYLFRFDNVKKIEDLPKMKPAAVFESNDDFKNGGFYRLFEDSRGDVWTSIRSGDAEKMGLGLWRRGENKFYFFGEKEDFPSRRSPSAFCEDSAGNLWIGFYHGGLVRWRDGKFTLFSGDDGLQKGFVTSLFQDHSGRLWIGTGEDGLSVVEDVSAVKPVFKRIEGISSDNVRAITEDELGRIYVGTVRGLDRISPERNQILHFSSADGLAADFITTAFRDRSGALWFGTRNGISKFTPQPDLPMREPPILISGIRVAGEKQPVSEFGAGEVGTIDLKYSQNNLEIDFLSLGFASADRVLYQYRLEGADENWSKPTRQRTVNYSNLAAGEYRFLVRAINSQGLISQKPAVIAFKISPPIWQTRWFFLLAVLSVGLASYYLISLRFRRRLELEKVRTRIATDLHDDIGASLSRISMLSEIVKRQDAGPDSAERLTQIAGDARNLVDSMSDIVWAIDPRRDSIENVVDRICSFAVDTLGTKGVHWTVDVPPDLSRLHLTAEQKRNLYLIFKEAVNNSARHSECRNASLKIKLRGSRLLAEIADDGRGFSRNGASGNRLGGRGLGNLRARAAEIGGEIKIESKENGGTKIILTIPLKTSRINMRFKLFGK
ncbi:MAG: two-component regulator propeller domain-containing protein [Pyrinomonadaceae bacterium]